MKPFNLEKALAGEPVKLRNGYKAFVLKKLDNPVYGNPILIGYYINKFQRENTIDWSVSGSYFEDCEEDMLDIVGMWEDLKPTIKIGGIDVPEPEREPCKNGEVYYIPALQWSDLVAGYAWDGGGCDIRYLKRGLVHKTEEAAQQHARALLALTECKED